MHNERPNTLDIPSHDEASAVMRHVRENVARRQLEDLPLVLVLLAVLYAFHGCVALNVVAFGPVYIPFFIAAVALICCAFFLSRIRSWRWSHPAIATIVGLLLATTLVSIHSAGNPLETTTLLIIVVAAGFVFASTGWLFFVLALIGICWSILAWTTFSPDHFRHFSMSLLTAILVSLLMHVQRLGSLREAQRLHVLSERRNMQLQEEVQRRMLAESTLLESQRELENRVADRTTELANSNESLRREICERRKADERTAHLQAQLAHANRVSMLGEMATSLAHEMKQPLSIIGNYASACIRGEESGTIEPNELRESLQAIRSEADRGCQIVEQVRSFAMVQAPDFSDVQLNEIVAEAATLFRLYIERHEACLRLGLADDLPKVRGNRVQLLQVVTNLLQNAIDAIDVSSDRNKTITVQTSFTGDDVTVSVADKGPGISTEIEQRLFDPYVTSKLQGLGMGLSICRTVIQLHGGRLWFDRNEGIGVTFRFAIPKS